MRCGASGVADILPLILFSCFPLLPGGGKQFSSQQLIIQELCKMFAKQCSRMVTSRTAVPLIAYLSRVGRPYSTAPPAYENILTSSPKPGVGLSKYTNSLL